MMHMAFYLAVCLLNTMFSDTTASFLLPDMPGQVWKRVGYLNMSDPTQQCPGSWQTISSPVSSCAKKASPPAVPCDSVNITTSGASYQMVCGRFSGYQVGSTDAFYSYAGLGWNLENYYVDGISITYGSPGNRHHVYTYAAGDTELNAIAACPCAGGRSPPSSLGLGSDYYCESGNPLQYVQDITTVYYADVLWDGQLCRNAEATCCDPSTRPWFCKTFPSPITENLEVRICLDEELDNENVAIQFFELYILATTENTSTNQICQYNYTIGTNLPVIITRTDPVCLICSNISNNLWAIGTDTMPSNPAAPYILYVRSPAITFLGGPTVSCYAAGPANIISSTVYTAAPVLPQVVTYVKEKNALNLDCSNVITASASAIQLFGQMWLGNINGQLSTVSRSSTLFQSYSSVDISGNYTCVTKLIPNAYGVTNVTSTIQVVVYRAPTVWNCVALNGLLHDIGQITCSIGGIPVPSITWTSPNGSVLVSQSTYSINSNESSTSLTVSSLVAKDAGRYIINASNVGGWSSSYANLSVNSNNQTCQYNYTIGANLPVIITQSDPVCLICSNISNNLWTIGADTMPANPAAPYILYVSSPATTFLGGPTVSCYAAGPANIISSTVYIAAPVLPQVVTYVKETDALSLDCSNVITASASAIQLFGQRWLGNINGRVYTVSNSSTYSPVNISGNYTCVTKLVPNVYGVTNVTSTVQVVVYRTPTVWNCVSLIGSLHDFGQITCSIGGIPVPSITWTSPNGRVLVSNSRYSINSDGSIISLTISSINPEDAGMYTIYASNVWGWSSSYANLSVYSNNQTCHYNYTIGANLPVIITQSGPVCLICSNISNNLWAIGTNILPANPAAPYILYVQSPATTFLGGPTVACYAAGPANIISSTVYIAAPVLPQVVTYVKENNALNLDCSNVITASASAIQLFGQMWLGNVNGQVNTVSRSSTYFQSYSSARISGSYTCVTKLVPNAYGVNNVTSTIKVVVYSVPTVSNCISLNGFLHNIGRITCFIEGIPVPSITWTSPNGSVLAPDQPGYSIYSDRFLATLTIASLVPEDAGRYTINASNVGGWSSSYANLSIYFNNHSCLEIGSRLPIIITQPAPASVCLLCPVISSTVLWQIEDVITFQHDATPYEVHTTILMENSFVACFTGIRFFFSEVYLAAPVFPTVLIYVNEYDTLTLNCSSVITVSSPIVDSQNWLDPLQRTISNSSMYSLFGVSRKAAGNYTCVTYFVPNSNGVANVSSSTTVIVYYPPTIQSPQPTVYGVQGHSVQLSCTFDGLPVPNITWTSPNRSVLISQSHFMVQSINTSTSLILSFLGFGDSGTYTCNATNSIGVSSASIQLIVQYPPTIQSSQPTVYGVQGHSVQLNCTFDGLPVPNITWTSPNGSVLISQSHFMVQSINTSTSLILSFLGFEDSGTYTCNASNSIGVSSASIQLIVQSLMPTDAIPSKYFSTSSLLVGLAAGVPLSILMGILIIGILIAAVLVLGKRNQNKMREKVKFHGAGYVHFDRSSLGTGSLKRCKPEYDAHNFEDVLVHYDQLHMDEQPCGSGEFVIVYHAALATRDGQKQDVAVKSVKNKYSEGAIRSFLEECSIMKSFNHPNVLGLVGMCLDSPEQVPLLVLPFMANGNLKKYLQHARSSTKTDQYPEGLSCHVLTSMCLDIARGMSYLADKRLVHKDLAARNCMVDINLMIKVGDFGLSRDMYQTDYYKMSDTSVCPIKWMPPEMIRDGISSEKSDVWAFGVTSWEVFSIGTNPYPNVENCDILQYLDKGLRLEQTILCPDKIFVLMNKCWLQDPQARPTFQQLAFVLELELHQN